MNILLLAIHKVNILLACPDSTCQSVRVVWFSPLERLQRMVGAVPLLSMMRVVGVFPLVRTMRVVGDFPLVRVEAVVLAMLVSVSQ